jgi:C4-dicarboxylate-specific signal transduction histidine kinase
LEIEVKNFTVDESRADRSDNLTAGPHVLLTVTDTGTGIASEIIDRIFDPFFTTKPQGRGTGLGLATTLGIVRSYGGDVAVYSEPGTGTKFLVFLPSSKQTTAAKVILDVRDEDVDGNGETILIVDDESLILETARETLESRNYRVLTASSGAEATKVFQQQRDRVDLVLLDMMMPGTDGFDTKDAVRAVDPTIRVIASSGLRRSSAEGGRLADVDGFLPKPYSDEQLLRMVRQVLDAKTVQERR